MRYIAFLPLAPTAPVRSSRARVCRMASSQSQPFQWPSTAKDAEPLNAYLRRSRQHLLSPAAGQPRHIFLGNEGADLDSIVSALILAYSSDAGGQPGAVPVVNCPRADIALRGDADAALRLACVDLDSITTVDELRTFQAVSHVTLVDHNDLALHQRALADRVCAIVDHHADARAHIDIQPRIVDLVGSCSTLVFERCSNVLAADSLDPTAASLLLSAILVDTRDLRGGVARDAAAASQLCDILGLSEAARTAFFAMLYEKKSAQMHLSTRDLLRRDYKRFEGGGLLVGISSVGVSFLQWSTRPEQSHSLTEDALRSWGTSQGLDLAVVMTLHGTAESYTREILFLDLGRQQLARPLTEALAEADSGLGLDVLRVPSLENTKVLTFVQGNATLSRKKVAPLVLDFLKQLQRV